MMSSQSLTKAESPAKEARLHIRASSTQKALLARAAQSRHLKVSQFVLQSCLAAAEQVMREQETQETQQAQAVIRVSAEHYDWLRAKLEEPPQENPALRLLLAEAPGWNG